MNIDSFWKLMEKCRQQADRRDARRAWLRGELSRRPLGEIVEFQLRLDQVTCQASTSGLEAAAKRIFGGRCSDDDFCYFALWMVGLGAETFERAVADPDSLAYAPEVQRLEGRPRRAWGEDWPGWELLDYVASEAYGLAAGDPEEYEDAFDAAVEAEQGERIADRGPVGEPWNARDRDGTACGLPRLSAMFPPGRLEFSTDFQTPWR